MNTGKRLIRFSSLLNRSVNRIWINRYESTQTIDNKNEVIDLAAVEEVPKYSIERTPEEEAEILRKRNKSRLSASDYKKIHGVKPYDENIEWFHERIRYKRRMLGRYGMKALDVPVGICWPLPDEIQDKLEREKVAYPKTIQQLWKEIEEKKREDEEKARLRDEHIAKQMIKVDQWRKDIQMKIQKKEAAVREAKERKDRLVEEVRRQFGFKIDPKDERFKQALELKEKEDKKRKKENKKQERNAKIMAKLLEKSNLETKQLLDTAAKQTSDSSKGDDADDDKKTNSENDKQ